MIGYHIVCENYATGVVLMADFRTDSLLIAYQSAIEKGIIPALAINCIISAEKIFV